MYQSLGELKKGSLVTLYVQSTTLFKSAIALFSSVGEVAKLGALLAGVERLVERRSTDTLPEPQKKIVPSDAVEKLELQDVSFVHGNSETKILKNVSIRVTKGQTIALVGLSGSGKSTLSHLLMGLLKPTTGQVFINDLQLDSVDESWWHKQISWVSQDSLLFSGSVEDNLRFAKENATVAEMIEALKVRNIG